jgi:hypothetical protein
MRPELRKIINQRFRHEALKDLFEQSRAAWQRALALHDNPHPPGNIRRRQ